MKAIVIYDSVSNAKLTAKVAEAIATSLRGNGMEVSSVPVQSAKHVNVEEYDLLVLGSPTMAWAPTKDTKDFMGSLAGKKLSGKKAASFDTQFKSVISGNANKAMEAKLKELGFTIAAPGLHAYVKGKQNAYYMVDGELERAKKWAEELSASK
jgi:flavodoxin